MTARLLDERAKTGNGAPSLSGDGCLLLWIRGDRICRLNETALVVWKKLESSGTAGLTFHELVAHLSSEFKELSLRPSDLHRDVEVLISELESLGVLAEETPFHSQTRYRIKDDVFRTEDPQVKGALPEEPLKSISNLQYARPGSLGPVRSRDTLSALLALAAFDVVIRTKGFGYICRLIERCPVKQTEATTERIRQVCGAIERARIWYPRAVKCLQHSAVVTCLLRRAGAPARMVIAGRRIPFYAHAWSELGSTVVNDDQSVRFEYMQFKRCLSTKGSQLVSDARVAATL